MTSHAEQAHPTAPRPPAAAPKLHVQRSQSKETITIHFSALGKEDEEEEEELYGLTVPAVSAAVHDDSNVVTALEASEEMFDRGLLDTAAEVAIMPESSSKLTPVPSQYTSSPTSNQSLFPTEQKGSKATSSPSKSFSFPSSDKPFLNLIKTVSSDNEPRDGVPTVVPLRHRHLMKTLVKSLSSDTSQDSSSSASSSRLLDSRLNLQLFKQFTQSRMPTVSMSSASDSKTAPSSPLTSPESRSFFKVSEVEARFEDTKRRLSEVMYEPLQLLSKMMDEKSGSTIGSSSIYRPKALSASATELSSMTSLNNGHQESNNSSYSIKEEEGGDWEDESAPKGASGQVESPCAPLADTKNKPAVGSKALDNCSMSALAKQEDEDFCILYSEDFESCTNIEGDGGNRTDDAGSDSRAKVPLSGSTKPCDGYEYESEELTPRVPFYTLIILTAMVYGYFVLPLPTYVGGMVLGVGLGFIVALGVLWLAGPKLSDGRLRHSRGTGKRWNMTHLNIKEPDIFKGWMNEIGNYDPETYHATLTHSIYVRLEESVLRLSRPNHNIARRATHNEPKPDVSYISQKIYDLANSKVYLVPENLARKRVWNKKYPICIELAKQDDFMSKVEDDRSETTEERTSTISATGAREEGTGLAQGKGQASSLSRGVTLYLFGRTGREKEEWFRRIILASKPKVQMKRDASVVGNKNVLNSHSRSSSRGSLDEALASQPRPKEYPTSSAAAGSARDKTVLDYSAYMATLVPTQVAGPTAASPTSQSPESSPGANKKLSSSPTVLTREDPVAWVNAAAGRIFWDFLTEPCWAELVSKKIQMKLSKIRLPYFMNELTLTELDMGVVTPRILGASTPSVDHQGLWFDLEISYSGSFLMTLETKMNLTRLGKEGEGPRIGELSKDGQRLRTYCLADSDEESSSAGSSDEDSSELTTDCPGPEGLVGGHKPSKIMRFVDKIAKSKYFQKATETEFIKKKMEEVSNTPLLLTVEVQQLQGTLAVNIPPPPTDRIWYGFKTPPHLELKARPKLGEREVTLAHVTDWIEKKLDQEFQKIFVMPNMDDVWLTIMHSAMDLRTSGGPLAASPAHPESSQ